MNGRITELLPGHGRADLVLDGLGQRGQGLQQAEDRKKELIGIKKKTKQKQKQDLNVCS